LAGFHLLPTPQEQVQFFVAPHERRRFGAQRLEAAQNGAFAN